LDKDLRRAFVFRVELRVGHDMVWVVVVVEPARAVIELPFHETNPTAAVTGTSTITKTAADSSFNPRDQNDVPLFTAIRSSR
jgi:hypothetical protein